MLHGKMVLPLSLLIAFTGIPQLYAFTMENHVGIVQWEQASYDVENTKAKIIVNDPDMNKYPESIDRINIQVYSDSDTHGLTMKATETSVNSGIFETAVFITYGPSKEN